jgi:ribonuclease D
MYDRSYQLITSAADLAALCARLHQAEAIALDTEFIRERTYHPVLCLVQVASDRDIAVIDVQTVGDLAPLHAVLADTAVQKVLHAARQDLEIFALQMGEVPAPVFDTQIAASLLGHGDQAGYAAVVQTLVGAPIDKGLSRTDWAQRPLSDAALAYAADDVRYLLEVYRKLRDQLIEKGRLEWLAPQFAELSRLDTYRVDPEQVWHKVRGQQRLKPEERARLARLAAWRERLAISADRPRGWIVKDEVLLDIVRRVPRTLEDLARIRDVQDGFVRRRGEELLALLDTADAPGITTEPPRERLTADQDAVLDLMMALARVRADEHKVAAANLAPRRELERLLRGERDIELLSGWRRDALGAELLRLLDGELAVRVAGGRVIVGPV